MIAVKVSTLASPKNCNPDAGFQAWWQCGGTEPGYAPEARCPLRARDPRPAITATDVWLVRAPRTRLRTLEEMKAKPGRPNDVASRITSPANAAYYRRYSANLCDRGLIFKRTDQVLVTTAAGAAGPQECVVEKRIE